MGEKSWNSVEVRFIDYDQVIRDLRQAVAEARARYPEIVKVLLFGSLVKGNWTAESDADLIVVVREEFPDILSRSPYQIHTHSIPTDSLVYSEREFERLAKDPTSFLAQNLASALEL
jgi:predicted nucleotidyltransferase